MIEHVRKTRSSAAYPGAAKMKARSINECLRDKLQSLGELEENEKASVDKQLTQQKISVAAR